MATTGGPLADPNLELHVQLHGAPSHAFLRATCTTAHHHRTLMCTATLRSLKASTMAATGGPPRGPKFSAANAACWAMLDAPLVLWLCMVEAAFTKWRGPAR
eukprot:1160379-Pelagomonas_calceolata.AAC.16